MGFDNTISEFLAYFYRAIYELPVENLGRQSLPRPRFPIRHKQAFLRMRSENRPQTRLLCCQIANILAPLWEIVVAEHDGEGSFYTGSRIDAISAHAH